MMLEGRRESMGKGILLAFPPITAPPHATHYPILGPLRSLPPSQHGNPHLSTRLGTNPGEKAGFLVPNRKMGPFQKRDLHNLNLVYDALDPKETISQKPSGFVGEGKRKKKKESSEMRVKGGNVAKCLHKMASPSPLVSCRDSLLVSLPLPLSLDEGGKSGLGRGIS